MLRLGCLLLLSLITTPTAVAQVPKHQLFAIRVVDEETGRGVPLVELRTTNDVHYVTDSNGLVAFDEPGLMNRLVFFHVKSHGYEHVRDGFGYRGKALLTTEGGEETIKLKRINIAQRLYRQTGGGIYRDTLLLGRPAPIREPLLNAQVLGSDSVVTTLLNGKILWFWGDTNRPGYPLGNFNVPGATSSLPGDDGLDPDTGVNLTYELDSQGFAKATARMPGEGPTWIFGLVTLREAEGDHKEIVMAGYVKVRPPMEVYQHGICEYDPKKHEFVRSVVFPEKAPVYPEGQPLEVMMGTQKYFYFALGYPFTRVKADASAYRDIKQYEAYTPLKPGSRLDSLELELDNDERPIWAWKRDTPALRPQDQQRLIRTGKLQPEDGLLALRDADTGKEVLGHAGSVYWNEHRKRWIMIICEQFGTSLLGETWFAEADSPLGPWVYARKVVTHDKYSFYNPKQHPYFAREGGRFLYFEGTYTASFSGNSNPTPRYDYNQIMYRLDLDDSRLNLPEPIREGEGASGKIAFYAKRRPGPGLVPVYRSRNRLILSAPEPKAIPAFFAIPVDAKNPPATSGLLAEVEIAGATTYRVSTQSERPVCRVWINPLRVDIPDSERGHMP